MIPKERRRRDKVWITEEILELMDERRRVKNVSAERYRQKNKENV